MPLTVKDNGGDMDFELCPAGNHIARCYSVVDLGMVQKGGQYPGFAHKIRWSFEIPGERMTDNRAFSISEKLTASLSKKAHLYAKLISWRGREFTPEELDGFDLQKVVGVPCLVNVVHNTSQDGSKTYANIASISALPKGMEVPPLENDALFWSFGDPGREKLPDWLQKQIGENPATFVEPSQLTHQQQDAPSVPGIDQPNYPAEPQGYDGPDDNGQLAPDEGSDWEDSIPF